jgi:HEPN domain-containing protein
MTAKFKTITKQQEAAINNAQQQVNPGVKEKQKKVMKNLYLTPEQNDLLKKLADKKGIAVTALLRLLIDKYINENSDTLI